MYQFKLYEPKSNNLSVIALRTDMERSEFGDFIGRHRGTLTSDKCFRMKNALCVRKILASLDRPMKSLELWTLRYMYRPT